MLDNISIQYPPPSNQPLLTIVDGLTGVMGSSDLSIVRLYTKIPGEGNNNVFSKVIFLSEPTYLHWKRNEILIINERFQSIDYRSIRFINGLEVLESYLENRSVDIDDKDAMAKIRNFIVNAKPSSEKLTSFIQQSILTLKSIILSGDETEDFDKISDFYFTPPNPEDELSDFILITDQILTDLDTEFEKNDLSFITPDDANTSITLFNSHNDREKFLSNIANVNIVFNEHIAKKKTRLATLLKSDFFKRQKDENTLQASDITPTAKIIRTIEDETKICNECNNETSSKYCQNINCKSLSPNASVYKLPVDINIDLSVMLYPSITSPYSNLTTLSNVNKQAAISLYSQEFSDLLNYTLMESETSISICTRNTGSHKYNPEQDLISNPDNKTAIMADKHDIKGQNVHFWDYFRSGSDIYAIIQHEDEIKTPTLIKEVKGVFEKRKRSFNTKITEDFYQNTILYVVADMYGQIKTCREGILDTSNPSKTLLSLTTHKYADTVRLIPTSVRPLISDIMYVPIKSPENYNYKSKGEHLLSMLGLDDLNSSELAEKPEEYRFSRRFFYRLSKGYLVYESSSTLYKITNFKIPQKLATGSIDKIKYTKLKEAIGIKSFLKEQGNLYIQFLKNFMFSPDKSANLFYQKFKKTQAKKAIAFKSIISEKNSILDCIYPNKYNHLLLNEQTQVSKQSLQESEPYKIHEIEAYRIKNCTPFFMNELYTQPIVDDIIFTIHYNQGNTRNAKLNNLSDFTASFNNNISDFLPIGVKLGMDKVVTKQLLQNGLCSSTQEDTFTVSLTISLSEDIDFYELTLFEKYLAENGVYTQNRTKESLPISILPGDLLGFII